MKESEILNVAILGASGFIGRNLTEYLVTKKNLNLNFFIRKKNTNRDAFLVSDIDADEALESTVKGSDVVIYLMTNSFPGSTLDAPLYDLRYNLEPALKIIELCKKHNVTQFIYVSSGGAVYGVQGNIPILESDTPMPISSYGVTKLSIENYLRLATLTSNLNVCVLRVSNPYGKYQSLRKGQGIISTIAHNIMNDKEIIIWGDGNVIRDYISINDVTHAIYLTINCTKGYSVYNIGSGKGRSINELLTLFQKATKKVLEVNYQSMRKIDVPVNVLCTEKFKNSFNWQCQYYLENEIENLLEWYKDAKE
jgi:UDP-glucose 4-epimerase